MDGRVFVKMDSVPHFHLTRSLYKRKDSQPPSICGKTVTNEQRRKRGTLVGSPAEDKFVNTGALADLRTANAVPTAQSGASPRMLDCSSAAQSRNQIAWPSTTIPFRGLPARNELAREI